MASNDLAIRFTEDKYATRTEVAKDLKTPLVDSFWKIIKDYRSNFTRVLSLKAVDNTYLNYCGCQTITNSMNKIEMKLVKLFSKYTKLDSKNGDLRIFQNKCEINSLFSIAGKYGLDVDENYLRSLIDGKITTIASSHRQLANYVEAFKEAKRLYTSPIDEDFIASVYAKLIGNSELISLYRTENDQNPENRMIIDRLYTSAPVSSIEPMMANLFQFLNSTTQSELVKSLVAYYFINYVKPFPNANDEIAVIVAKAILSHSDIDELALFLPLEVLLFGDQDTIARLFVEVQKTNDVTYFLGFGFKMVDTLLDQMLELINNLEANTLKNDYYHEAKIETGAISLFEEEAKKEEAKIPVPTPVEKTAVVEEKPIVKQAVVESPKPTVTENENQKEEKSELAFSMNLPILDEKDACRLEEHLLELDPELKKGQAYFYARHCTMGKRYTIGQYKKALGCAYETARTSMDSLANLGYYRQEMVKNKKVYTPISKK
ncbi:MAG: hypothetical protein VB015_04345 [Erysipelotrichaceae bacterium]|nr:hypothetical protein [Erysipelotrichaceae bacterium]